MAIFHSLFRLMAVFVACVLGSGTVGAAEIRVDPSGEADTRAILEGKITAGDFDKIVSYIINGHRPVEIYLASPGGDLAEAMKIGLLVRSLKLSTIVPSKTLSNQKRDFTAAQHDLKDPKANYMCASACFFVFVAGIHRSHDLGGPAILGIHEPFLSENDVKRLGLEQASAAAERVRTVVEKYLKEMGISLEYAKNMYFAPKGSIQWIRNDEFEADFNGFIPELQNRVDAKCDESDAKERQEQLACEKKNSGGTSSWRLRRHAWNVERQSSQIDGFTSMINQPTKTPAHEV